MAKTSGFFVRVDAGKAVSEALKNFYKYDAKTREALHGAVLKTAIAVEKGAKAKVGRVTGALEKSITHDITSLSSAYISAHVRAKAPHASLVEFGAKMAFAKPREKKAMHWAGAYSKGHIIPTRKPRPFLKPAAEAERSKLEEEIKKVLNQQ